MTYYCITTSINDRTGVMTFNYTDLHIGERRPKNTCENKTYAVTEYKDWYTDKEIRTEFPDIARRYNF